jgi:SNF2 family DNA or RNA helicase
VVAPVSVLGTWEKEAKNVLTSRNPSCVPNLKVFVISSTMKRAERQRYLRLAVKGDRRYKFLVVTTYGLVANDPLDFLVHDRGFDYVVLDEGA